MRILAPILLLLTLLATFTSCKKDDLKTAPIADFSYAGGDLTPPATVTFTNLSVGDGLTFTWDFGDGSFSTDMNPVHTYPSSGTYTVRLTAKNEGGSHEISRTLTVKNLTQIPVANFNYAYRNDSTAPCLIEFYNTSIGDSLEYLWDFGDGSTSVGFSPYHTYTAAGTYSVKLLVRNRVSQSEKTRTVTIKPGKSGATSAKIDYMTLSYLSVGIAGPNYDTKVNIKVTDIFGNQLVKAPEKILRSTSLPLAISLGWDTEPALTDLSATYRIVISTEYLSSVDELVLVWQPNEDTAYPEFVSFSESSNSGYTYEGSFHAIWGN